MYRIQPGFCKNQYSVSYNLQNNMNNNTNSSKLLSSNADFAKASAENYKANYMVGFKGGMSCEQSNTSGIGTLNHQTAFFREPGTDEIVQDYILENFNDDKKINIVSGACSSGEEAKSYAMMLDSLNDKLKIIGFDISPESIKEAQGNACQITRDDDDNPYSSYLSLDSENILFTENIDNLTEYERKCRNKFRQYYQPKGLPYKVPVFPNAKKELHDFEALLANKESVEKLKDQYNEQMQMVKSMAPGMAKFTSNITFEDSINMQRMALEQQAATYKTVADFETEDCAFENCSFDMGDITNIEHLYKPGSINVLLYRNALYHTLCKGDNMFRYMKDDAPEIMDSIAKQMNKILKSKGLVVFGESEYLQGINPLVIKEIMENNGFKLLQIEGKDINDNIWVKCEDIFTK